MILLGLIIGIYANIILLLGFAGILYKWLLLPFTILYFFITYAYLKKRNIIKRPKYIVLGPTEKGMVLLLLIQGIVTLIGVLGPETAYDALWYHLTLPKLFLQNHAIVHIPGGLFYYSDMPKLTELLYLVGLTIGSETIPKLIHFLFGIGVCIALFSLARRYMERKYAILTVLLFSSNLVVGWEATSAYIDLARTFFEVLALLLFIRWHDSGKKPLFYYSAIFLGLAISTKLLALGSLPIFVLLILYFSKSDLKTRLINSSVFAAITIFIPSPWLIRSYVINGNPVYPFLTQLYPLGNEYHGLSPISFIRDIWQLFTTSPDPISPLFLIALPLVIICLVRKNNKILQVVSLYSLLSLFIWYFLPRVGGGRFILPYLPAFSFLVVYSLKNIMEIDRYMLLSKITSFLIILYALVFIVYRSGANLKYLPYLSGQESKAQFLSRHLNFSFGDFYDTDNFFKQTITKNDRVLLIGFHNLYYVKFPFIDQSYAKKGDRFNYIAVQNAILPKRFNNWNLIYSNTLTHVMVYSTGGMKWVY